MTLDRCVQRLRKRMLTESHTMNRGTAETQGLVNAPNAPLGMSNKLPSFYTSPSLVNLSGLSVADQPITTSKLQERGRNGSANSMFKNEGWGAGGETIYRTVVDSRSEEEAGEDSARTSTIGSVHNSCENTDTYLKSTAMASFYYKKILK